MASDAVQEIPGSRQCLPVLALRNTSHVHQGRSPDCRATSTNLPRRTQWSIRQTLQRCVRQAALGYRCGGSAGFDQLPVSGCSIRAGSTPWRIKNVAHLKVRGGSGTSESAASRRVVRSCHVGCARCSVTGRPGAHARRLRCRRRRGHIRRASGSVWRARRSSPASPGGASA